MEIKTRMDEMLNDVRHQIWHLENLVDSQQATIYTLLNKLEKIKKIMNDFNTKSIEQDTIAYLVKKEVLDIICEG